MNENNSVNILVVDDSLTHLKIVQAVLNPLKQNIITAISGEEAIKATEKNDFAVILLDVSLPGIDGFQTAAKIRENKRSQKTPIIFMTALETSDVKIFQGYNQGAVDFLIKPIPPYILKSKVSVFMEIYQQNNIINTQNTYIDKISENIQQQEIEIKQQATLLESTKEAIMICDLDHNIQFWNQGSTLLYGWKKHEILGKNWHEILKTKCNDSLEDIKKELILKDFWKGEFLLFTKKNKPIITSHSWTLRTDYKGKPIGYFSISADITDSKKEQLEVRRSLEKAQEKNFFREKFINDSFLEIKNSLNLILGITQLIRLYKNKLNMEQLFSHIERMENYTKNTSNLIEDLSFIIKSHSGKNQELLVLIPVNVYKVCQNLVETLKFGIGRNHLISFMIMDELQQTITNQEDSEGKTNKEKEKSLIYLDEKIIWKMLNILLSNAIQYSKDKTRIDLKLTYQDDNIVFLIEDQGIGIPTEDQPYIFEPFYRGKNTDTIPGLGVGLHLVKTYVKLHKGNILMSSIPGQGSSFQITLPRNLKPD
jgi:two-component system, cell cycle sensor histidine kinase and response regulator CckA